MTIFLTVMAITLTTTVNKVLDEGMVAQGFPIKTLFCIILIN